MTLVSVIIPSRNEIFLNQTIRDVLSKAQGEVEIFAVIDEHWPPELVEDPRVKYLHPRRPHGMRYGINQGVSVSHGEYLMKIDAHCLFDEGWDLKLLADMQDNWMVIPRRYSLDALAWKIQENGKSPRDYHYLCYPNCHKEHDLGMHGVEWPERSRERRGKPEFDIDETPSLQGSCWFMKRTWFDYIGPMQEHGYGGFSQEPQELGNKTWLGGGQMMINKKTYYAHLHKGKQFGRMYRTDMREIVRGHNYSAWYWMNNTWPKQIHKMQWLIEHFWPMPTWPEEWHTDWDKAFAEWYAVFPKEAEGVEIL